MNESIPFDKTLQQSCTLCVLVQSEAYNAPYGFISPTIQPSTNILVLIYILLPPVQIHTPSAGTAHQ